MAQAEGITTKKADDISNWYEQVCVKSQLAEFGEVKGTFIIRPKGYFIWEQIQQFFSKELLGPLKVDNCYFPMLIPERFFVKEAEHAQGFAPELAWVAAGVDQGDEKAIIRPTSETIIVDSFRRWLRNYKQLPIKVNQWVNVLRWEVKQTKLFLRSREFLWQEGHCIYQTEQECRDDVLVVLDFYKRLAKELLAVPVIAGKKTPAETFPGAVDSYSIEGLMPDGKALQMGTSHYLGQSFMKAFDVEFMGSDEQIHMPHYNSWGVSTRLLGALIMTHSDDKGLVLPPRIAKTQVVIVPVANKDNKERILEYCQKLVQRLDTFRVFFDDREGYSMGFKLSEHELQGIPLVIIVGQKEVEQQQVTFKPRDIEQKRVCAIDNLATYVAEELDAIHNRLYEKAELFMQTHIEDAQSVADVERIVADGKFARAYFDANKNNEHELFDSRPGLSARCSVLNHADMGRCILTGVSCSTLVIFGRSY